MSKTLQVLAKNIKARRKEFGLTQAELAKRLSYSEKAISKWECGLGCPPTLILPTLAEALGTSVDALFYEEAEHHFFLGIDGGGTKTDFALANENGTLLCRIQLGTTNPADIGLDMTKDLLRRGILESCAEHRFNTISVYAGLAGMTEEIQPIIFDFLSKFGFSNVRCGNDAQNAVAAALPDIDGVVAIFGTGSIVYRKKEKSLHRIGGYGFLFGDAGSGFAIGRDSILAALQYEDGSGGETMIHSYIKEQCGTPTVLSAIDRFYEGGKREIASYASTAFLAYEHGDRIAENILTQNINSMASLIQSAARPLGDEVDIVLCGGLMHHQKILLPMLTKALGNDKKYRISVCTRPLVYGALRLAGLENEITEESGKEKQKC